MKLITIKEAQKALIQDNKISNKFSASYLQRYIAKRPTVHLNYKIDRVRTVIELLSTLDVMKKGLVEFRGGTRSDAAYYVGNDNTETNRLFGILKSVIPDLQCLRSGSCGREVEYHFYSPFRKPNRSEWKILTMEKGCKFSKDKVIEGEINESFIGTEKIILLWDRPSAVSSLYLIISFLEVYIDSIEKIGLLPASEALCALNTSASWAETDFVANSKYITAYPMAKYLKNDLPNRPVSIKTSNIFGPKIKKILRSRLNTHSSKAISLFQGILQGVKRGAAVVPEVFIGSTLTSHMEILSKEPKKVNEEFMENFLDKTEKLFKGFKFHLSDALKLTEPSKSAAYNEPARWGGQEAGVLRKLDYEYNSSGDSKSKKLAYDLTNYNDLMLMSEGLEGVFTAKGKIITEHDKRRLIDLCYKELEEKCSVSATVVALKEFLKVRVITAGEAAPYYIAKPFQKKVLRHLHGYKQFDLTKGPLNGSHIYDIFETFRNLNDFLMSRWLRQIHYEFIVSGDYKSATDGIEMPYTLAVFDTIRLCGLKSSNPTLIKYWSIMRKLLEPHVLVYSKSQLPYGYVPEDHGVRVLENGKKSIMVWQENGQLMGCPISFPILCIINVIPYWMSMEEYVGGEIPFELLPVRINGDDISFPSNTEHYKIWLKNITEVGFKLSLGKNYIHPTIVTMNSELYKLDIEFDTYNRKATDTTRPFLKKVHRIDYFNSGLITAQSKGKSNDWTKDLSLGDMYYLAVSGANDKIRAHKRFIHHNQFHIKKMTQNGKFNLFLPRIMGGIGFPIIDAVTSEIVYTKFQRRFARFFLGKIRDELSNGNFPKDYLFAFVKERSATKQFFELHHGKYNFSLEPFGPLAKGWKIYDDVPAWTTPAFGSKVFEEVEELDVLDRPSEYRLPSKKVLDEFQQYQRLVCGTSSQSISNSEILDAYGYRVTFTPSPLPTETPIFLRRRSGQLDEEK